MELDFSQFNLPKQLGRALAELNFESPRPIQVKAFPLIRSGKDTVGIAQTGTGKTLAYLLPLLSQHVFSKERHPRVLILVPTRELVAQVVTEIEKLSKYLSLRVFGIYGASNINTQKQKVYEGLDILVATPGRLIDLMISRAVQLNQVKKLVIDEVDEMFQLGFRPQLMQIVNALPSKRQNILFSATLTEEIEQLIDTHFNTPEYLELVARGTPLEKIIQKAVAVPNHHTKVNYVKWLMQHDKTLKKVLLFVNNKDLANELETALQDLGDEVGVIHSNKTQANRFKSVEQFQNGFHRILIATDVIARGLDLKDVSHVINFSFPKDANTYIHRIGRTGRAEAKGIAISFVTDKEKIFLKAAEATMNKKVKVELLPKGVEVSNELTFEEMPKTRVKKLGKAPKNLDSGGAFHEKKGKNKKIQLGGKRRQEKQRRALAKSISKRKR